MSRRKLVQLKGIVNDTSFVEAFEKLQVNIKLASVDKEIKVIQITSSVQDEGKTTVAVNLANAYALKGAKVIVIDLDIRRPKVHRNFNQPNENGIVDYATGNIKKDQLIKHTNYNIDVILTGSKTPYPVKILESELIKSLINECSEKYDYVILDTPPVSAVVDPIVISKFADAVVFVVQAESTKKNLIKDSIKQLENAQANIVGLAITGVRERFTKYYKYYED